MSEKPNIQNEPTAVKAEGQADLRGVSLPDVVHLECVGRNSSVLELFQEQSLGRIYIDQGQIVHAVCGEISGERAFQKLFTITTGTFELLEFEVPPERTINRTWEFLLDRVLQQRAQAAQRAQSGEITSAAAPAAVAPIGQAVEMLIAAGTGEVFYNWQCAAPADRLALLQKFSALAEKLIPDLQLGKLDRIEFQLAAGRAILHPRADRLVFLQVATAAAQT